MSRWKQDSQKAKKVSIRNTIVSRVFATSTKGEYSRNSRYLKRNFKIYSPNCDLRSSLVIMLRAHILGISQSLYPRVFRFSKFQAIQNLHWFSSKGISQAWESVIIIMLSTQSKNELFKQFEAKTWENKETLQHTQGLSKYGCLGNEKLTDTMPLNCRRNHQMWGKIDGWFLSRLQVQKICGVFKTLPLTPPLRPIQYCKGLDKR